jgi:hypothetical protein
MAHSTQSKGLPFLHIPPASNLEPVEERSFPLPASELSHLTAYLPENTHFVAQPMQGGQSLVLRPRLKVRADRI